MTNCFEDYIQNDLDLTDIHGISCQTFHPKIRAKLRELLSANDLSDMWSGRLTLAQRQLRSCATTELTEAIQNDADSWKDGKFEGDLETLVSALITLTLLLKGIADEYESA